LAEVPKKRLILRCCLIHLKKGSICQRAVELVELLRQVAERLAYFILLVQHVSVAKADAAFIRLLESGEDTHQRRLAGTVRAEQAVHSRRNREGHVLQRLHAVRIGLGHVADV
jgi:hypothetical protein